jgi:short-subunit dehydrogenase
MSKPWFGPKEYGFGLSPISPAGWIATLVYVIVLMSAAFILRHTGASSGIGEAFARALAARGCDLALSARRAERLEALAAELSAKHGIEAFAVPADLSVLDAHEAVLAAIAARGRHVDILVNNAGFSIAQSFADVPWARQQDFLMTLVVNACGLAHGVIPGMVARGQGRIINIASWPASRPASRATPSIPAPRA